MRSPALATTRDFVHQVVDLVLRLADLDVGVDDPGRSHDLLDDPGRFGFLEVARRRRDHHQPVDPGEELVELERPVVDRRGQAEAEVDQGRLARAVALEHAADLRDRLVGLVDEADEVVGEVVDQRVRRAAGGAAVEDPRVVLDPRGEADLLDHLEVVGGALAQAVGLQLLAFLLQLGRARFEFGPDLLDRALDRLVLGHVVRGRPDRDVVDHVEDFPGQRVEVLDPLDLVAEEGDPVGRLGVGGHDLQHLAADPERAAPQHLVVALVLHLHQLAQDLVAIERGADFEQLHFFVVDLGRADPVDAGDRGDDDHVAASEQRGRRRVAQAVDLVVDRGVLLDVEVLGRDVGLGLVVVVVGDEVLDRVVREELAELVAELGRQGLVVGDHQRRPLHRGDRRRHREGLAGAGGAEQGLEALVGLEPFGQAGDRLRLIRGRRVGGVELELGHALTLAGALLRFSSQSAEPPPGRLRRDEPVSRIGLAAFFNLTGILHFVIPRSYEAMVPEPVPAKEAVAISGVAEILGGLAVLHPATRRLGRWWLLALLIAVFPANAHMAINPEQIRGLDLKKVPRWALWARLPLQPLAMLWVWRATRD